MKVNGGVGANLRRNFFATFSITYATFTATFKKFSQDDHNFRLIVLNWAHEPNERVKSADPVSVYRVYRQFQADNVGTYLALYVNKS